MVLIRRGVRIGRKVLTGDTVPEPRERLGDLKLQVKKLRAARGAAAPREKVRKLQRQVESRVVGALEDIVRRGDNADERITQLRARLADRKRKPVDKFFTALEDAFKDQSAGGVLSTKRLGILLKTLGKD